MTYVEVCWCALVGGWLYAVHLIPASSSNVLQLEDDMDNFDFMIRNISLKCTDLQQGQYPSKY